MYGLIGYPLSHSFSPRFFEEKFKRENMNETYRLFPIEHIEQIKDILESNPDLVGLNVTIPYKETVIPLLDTVDADAKKIGAVNCIKIENGKLKGFNTDWIGFSETLKPLLQEHHKHALILGTGGASKAVAYALSQLGISFQFVSRRKTEDEFLHYEDLNTHIMNQNLIIINTTPLGMMPQVDTSPDIPYTLLSNQHVLYDLVYNPAETLFLSKGKQQGAGIKNGYDMLVAQAEVSWNLWNI